VAKAVVNHRVSTLEIIDLSRPISQIFTTIRAPHIQLIQAVVLISNPVLVAVVLSHHAAALQSLALSTKTLKTQHRSLVFQQNRPTAAVAERRVSGGHYDTNARTLFLSRRPKIIEPPSISRPISCQTAIRAIANVPMLTSRKTQEAIPRAAVTCQ
jgi:hypothetical protein